MTEAKKARLRVVSRLRDPDGGVTETKNARHGTLARTADGFVLAYDDEQEGERAHIELTVTRTAQGYTARMRRQGMMSGALVFRPSCREAGSYVTVYGEIPVAVDTRRVGVALSENGGVLTLDYDVYMGGEMTSRALLEITWRS